MKISTTSLSVTIIALNEEEYLEKCLDSVKDIADEIILVDSGSTDRTLEIAKKYDAKIFYRKFDNYANQKNYALEKASGEWILSLDGDEILETDSVNEIKSIIQKDNRDISAYSMPRKNIIFGKLIKHSRWQPELDRHLWLWRKNKGKWRGDVHEEVVVDGIIGKLKYGKIHYQYKNVSEFIKMINHYSDLESKSLIEQNISFTYIKLFFQPMYNFLVRYIYRLGFLDGWRGFILSFLMAFYHFILWVKIWHLSNIQNNN